MRTISIILFALLAGCTSIKESFESSAPQLLLQHPLPPLPESFSAPSVPLNLALYIQTDGSVEKIILIKGSGIASWDSAALNIIKQWRFSPARLNDQPISTWYYISTILRPAIPIYMTLAEIQCTTLAQVDSTYEQLTSGKQLTELTTPCCIDTVQGTVPGIATVNVYQYPEKIRNILVKLNVNEFSHPIPYGDRFIIFQRL